MLSIVVPAHNEEGNIPKLLAELTHELDAAQVSDFELIVVDDNSRDATSALVTEFAERDPRVRLVRRRPPAGFGRAIRAGLEEVRGEFVVICMADLSDDPQDVIGYYKKLLEGYDCVFGSRFIKGGFTENYPRRKLLVNRLVNRGTQALFMTHHNDLTNAFKAYRTHVVKDCGPYRSSHFNITLEMSLSALIRRYHIAVMPIRWYGRDSGVSKLKITEMGRRYLSTLLMMLAQRVLISDDLMAETVAHRAKAQAEVERLRAQLTAMEAELARAQGREPQMAAAG
jgi:dolichol-phosphate mannosyltransferase